MRTFEVRIDKNSTDVGGGRIETRYTWPNWWPEVIEAVLVEAYEQTDVMGRRDEGCVCVCEDKIWAIIEAKNDPRIVPLTESSANEKGRRWRPQVVNIDDPTAVLLVCAKAVSGGKLTMKEKKALDPNDHAKGICRSKLFDVRKICEGRGKTLNGG